MNLHHPSARVGTDDDSLSSTRPTDVATSCPQQARADTQLKRKSPMTFSQKLYQSQALEIATEFDQAMESNSVEKIKELLDKVLELPG